MVYRFHLSKKKIQTFYNTSNQIKYSDKPTGFWYSIDTLFDKTNGLTFNITNTNHCCYIYKLDIPDKHYTKSLNDKNKILILNTINRINRFIEKYKYKKPVILKNPSDEYFYINWKEVARDFVGIEFNPFFVDYDQCSWYSGVDLSSGCIWNKDIITKYTKLYAYKRKNKWIIA